MAQHVPTFAFSDHAVTVRQFLYEYCCEHGYAPNFLDVHTATGLARADLVRAYRELDLGGMIVIDHLTHNLNLLKVLPFSSFPTAVRLIAGGRFHSYLGCAMESVAASKMPPFAGKELRLDSYCACCLTPISVATKDGKIRSSTPDSALIHVGLTPLEWNAVNFLPMCDSMNYVLDAEHAVRYEKMTSRRGVVFSFDQAERLVAGVANNRMWDPHWHSEGSDGQRTLEAIRGLGVDVSNWT